MLSTFLCLPQRPHQHPQLQHQHLSLQVINAAILLSKYAENAYELGDLRAPFGADHSRFSTKPL